MAFASDVTVHPSEPAREPTYPEHAQPLQYNRDIDCLPRPKVAPGDGRQALVIGGGVSGLVTAWVLLDHGWKVTVLAAEWASYGRGPRLVSQIAGALWEFPPAVCGRHTDPVSLQHSKGWSMVSYHIWTRLAEDDPVLAREAGVRVRPTTFFFPKPVDEDTEQLAKMRDIAACGVRGFRRDLDAVATEAGLGPHRGGAADAYGHDSPVIDTDRCMRFLGDLCLAKGATFVTRRIEGDLLQHEAALRGTFGAAVIMNCTGLGAAETAADPSCFPIRGALLRVVNDGRDFPRLEQCLAISADVIAPQDPDGEDPNARNAIVFLVPRSDDILLVGGVTEPHEAGLDLTLDSPTVRRMRARCERFLPCLERARLDPDYPLAQGLRPFRGQNVRVERELRASVPPQRGRGAAEGTKPEAAPPKPSRIVHNYGHGGAGWSLSFGCAADVLRLAGEAVQDLPPRPMSETAALDTRDSGN